VLSRICRCQGPKGVKQIAANAPPAAGGRRHKRIAEGVTDDLHSVGMLKIS
jgi:hypothetical protein